MLEGANTIYTTHFCKAWRLRCPTIAASANFKVRPWKGWMTWGIDAETSIWKHEKQYYLGITIPSRKENKNTRERYNFEKTLKLKKKTRVKSDLCWCLPSFVDMCTRCVDICHRFFVQKTLKLLVFHGPANEMIDFELPARIWNLGTESEKVW